MSEGAAEVLAEVLADDEFFRATESSAALRQMAAGRFDPYEAGLYQRAAESIDCLLSALARLAASPPPSQGVPEGVHSLVANGLQIDGGHHKQWYLERIAEALGVEVDPDWYEPGIAP